MAMLLMGLLSMGRLSALPEIFKLYSDKSASLLYYSIGYHCIKFYR